MIVSQEKLLHILLYSLVVGVFLGVVYDIFRVRRISYALSDNVSRTKNIRDKIEGMFIILEDTLFFLICSVVMSIFMFYMNSGKFRAIAFFGALCGFIVYYKTVGRLVIACSKYIIGFIKYILRKIYSIFLLPLLHILRFLITMIVGRLIIYVFTYIKMNRDLILANNGFDILKKTNKGSRKNEETLKHIR